MLEWTQNSLNLIRIKCGYSSLVSSMVIEVSWQVFSMWKFDYD